MPSVSSRWPMPETMSMERRKMLALLRYRQLPYRLLIASNVSGGELAGLPMPRAVGPAPASS